MARRTGIRLVFLQFIIILFLSSCGNGGGSQALSPQDQTDVLFIGNSYTATNGLPDLFEKLADAGGHGVHAEMVAPGGWTLEDHVHSASTLDKIRGGEWDYVVLQDQSVIPSLTEIREQQMYPAVRQLSGEIKSVGAQPVLFMTWGRRDGLPSEGHADFTSMQAALEDGYLEIGDELDIPVAPVGTVWWNVLRSNPQFDLWLGDGSHPNAEGTYLAACVFYAVIFGESPKGLDYTAGIDEDRALIFQTTADDIVQSYSELWNLP